MGPQSPKAVRLYMDDFSPFLRLPANGMDSMRRGISIDTQCPSRREAHTPRHTLGDCLSGLEELINSDERTYMTTLPIRMLDISCNHTVGATFEATLG